MSDVVAWPATKTAKAIKARKISCEEVIQAFVDRIEVVNPKLNAVVQLTEVNPN